MTFTKKKHNPPNLGHDLHGLLGWCIQQGGTKFHVRFCHMSPVMTHFLMPFLKGHNSIYTEEGGPTLYHADTTTHRYHADKPSRCQSRNATSAHCAVRNFRSWKNASRSLSNLDVWRGKMVQTWTNVAWRHLNLHSTQNWWGWFVYMLIWKSGVSNNRD